MTLDHTTPIFFAAFCLIAATGSPAGGSGFLLVNLAQLAFLAVTPGEFIKTVLRPHVAYPTFP